MLFNSHEFIFLFFPVVFLFFFWIAKRSHHLAALWLAVVSLFFYAWWNPQYLLLLLISILFNYAMGCAISHSINSIEKVSQTKFILAIAVGFNLLVLGYFKYSDFFIDIANTSSGTNWQLNHLILPLGISFFTFTQIAFLVDVYRGIAREYNFVHYLLFVTYFPHLIAGPVLHHKQMMPQFNMPATYRANQDNINIGLTYFTIGFAKKVLLADSLSDFVIPVFEAARDGNEISFFTSWIGIIAYSFQLYFDFSGYSDMAIGLSKMFGIDLPVNFNSPYKAQNIIEFWKRWHMTLSQFLRDYLYIVLGGNRCGWIRRYLNIIITMFLGGLWHGANWTFVIWGLLHGIYIVINHAWRLMFPRVAIRRYVFFSIFSTYLCVTVAWVFFRADSLTSSIIVLKGLLGLNGISLPVTLSWMYPHVERLPFVVRFDGFSPELAVPVASTSIAIWFAFSGLIVWLLPNTQEIIARFRSLHSRRNLIGSGLLGILFALSVLSISSVSEFLYFQF